MEGNLFERIGSLYELGKVTVGERELNPLAYKENDYATIDEVLGFISRRKKVFPINFAQLSVTGSVEKDSFSRYLSNPSISSSALKQVLKTPLHYYCYMHEPVIKQTKKSFELGSFCHLAFLEPSLFDSLVVEPNYSRATKEGLANLKNFWTKQAIHVQKKTGKRILKTADNALKRSNLNIDKADGIKLYIDHIKERVGLYCVDENTKKIIDLIKRHYFTYGGGILPKLLKGAAFETSFYGFDGETKLPVKVRPDGFNVIENCGANILISFKTTSAENINKFWNDSAKFQYELSEGMYLEVMSQITGRKFNAVVTVMLQTVAPYLPAVFWWSPDDLQLGKYKFRSAIQTLKDCMDAGKWPGFDAFAEPNNQGLIEAGLPTYAYKELMPMGID
jgi:hypothetical protein